MYKETDHSEFSLLLRCRARQILRDYPSKVLRQRFYNKFKARHGEAALKNLVGLINREYGNFLGWCTLTGSTVSHSALLDYIEHTSPVKTPLDVKPFTEQSFPQQPTSSTRPWWADLPHLKPQGEARV